MSLEQIKDLVDAQGTAFEEFKAANDERLKQIEESGSADTVTAEKVEKINAEITQINDAIAEAQRDFAAAVTAGKKDDDRDIEAEAKVFWAVQREKPCKEVSKDEVEAFNRYENAFEQFVRAGGDQNASLLTPEIRAELSVGSDPDGGYLVPTAMDSRVRQRLYETSPMRQISEVTSITTSSLQFPVDTGEAASGGWVSEKEARSETGTPQVGMQTIQVHEQYAEPHVTQKLLDDAAIDVEAWLSGKIADKLTRTENAAFINGNGVGKPRGFLDYSGAATTANDDSRSWGILQYVASGVSGGFETAANGSADELIDLVHKLNPAYRAGARFTMNRSTIAEVRKLKDGDNNYLWSMGNIQTGQPQSLLGYGITEMEDMPDIGADSFSLAFGNFNTGYLIVDRMGIRVLRDPYTNKPFVKFYTTKRVGGDVQNFDAIKLFKFGTS